MLKIDNNDFTKNEKLEKLIINNYNLNLIRIDTSFHEKQLIFPKFNVKTLSIGQFSNTKILDLNSVNIEELYIYNTHVLIEFRIDKIPNLKVLDVYEIVNLKVLKYDKTKLYVDLYTENVENIIVHIDFPQIKHRDISRMHPEWVNGVKRSW